MPQNRPALVSLLNETLDRLQQQCVAPRQLVKTEVLWFKSDEVELVDALWRAEGLHAVYQAWKGERACEVAVEDLRLATNQAATYQTAAEAEAHHLLVFFYKYDPIQTPEGTNYYRSASFNLPTELQDEVKTALLGIDIWHALESEKFQFPKSYRTNAMQRELLCHVETFSEANPIERGTRLSLGLDVLEQESAETKVIFSIHQDASVSGLLWSESACETGYEGHGHFTYKPSDAELRTLLPVLAKICEQPPEYPKDVMFGAWRCWPSR